MEITIREKSEKIDELEKILTGNYPNKEVQFCCKECDKRFSSKNYLTSHRKISHPKDFKCKICEETFFDSWKLELHSKSHENIHPFRCGICDKQFYVNWRLKKHVQSHEQKQRFCHFFKNGKEFKHEVSKNCKFDKSCSLKHLQSTVESDIYKKYDDMNEHDQFDVYQEICLNISTNVWNMMRIMNYLGSMLRK